MLILLPPSEGKTAPRRGAPLALDSLSHPALNPTRERVLDTLVTLCSGDAEHAASVLEVGSTQLDLVTANARLREAPTGRADAIYTGVLYDHLDAGGLSAAAKRRASSRLAVVSSVFGLVRPGDRVPAYRLSGQTSLPGLGPVASAWRPVLGEAVAAQVGRGLVVDLRSSVYAGFWRPGKDAGDVDPRTRVATVRVLHEQGGKRKVVSHFNKATKGRIVRALLEDGADPTTPARLAEALRDLGWAVEVGEPGAQGTRLDVVVTEL
ncbi:peroxide stress protein YaaA [Nocardioides bruguierae]|uniref:Peroxide stress protein YaaA n=1 Tax=Nocardioides bruguierae TaxID=2945102 RepID=A0A9X2IEK0_9ACTN|nr:peroxide stress protein YaaA [Nocardioides bruguierae]MCM0619434.1 peroxide stress protein YaaA [Nocardioides bruguierae]